MIPTLIFDIETIPDVSGIRLLYNLDSSLSDKEIADFAFQKRKEATNSDFLPLHQHQVIVISCILRDGGTFKLKSFSEPELNEKKIIRSFFSVIEKYTPQVVSWNGGGFDFPVMIYRGLINGVIARKYWDLGEKEYNGDPDFRWNNYINRFHTRHLDLMDLFSLYQGRASAPLHEIARLLGLPGKMNMVGSSVWEYWQLGRIKEIRNYCEIDVINTYLIYQRFNLMRGLVSPDDYEKELLLVKNSLKEMKQPHLQEFVSTWGKSKYLG